MSGLPGDSGLPLTGIRVADFGWILAAPHATAWLGALGADVIRIENPRHVDIARFLGGTDGKMGINRGGGFHAINFSKRSIAIDLSTAAGAEIARRLVAHSDIAVENFATGTMRRFGLDYESLRAVRPDLIMLSATPLGQTGPFAAAVGYGPHTQAFSGICELTGYPDGHPCGLGGAWPDFEVGVLMVVAILTALHYRERTGEGQYIDLSIAEAMTATLPEAMMDYFMNGRVQGAIGNRDPEIAPHGVFPCAGEDRWIALAAVSDEEFGVLCEELGAPAMALDRRYRGMRERLENVDALERELAALTRRFERDELVALLRARNLAAGPVYNTAEVMADPAFAASNVGLKLMHKEAGERLVPGLPTYFSGFAPVYRGAPALGEHTDEVLGGLLGYSSQEIDRFREQGVVG
jgi:benzylsuccinate CoA-transferase BbsF subunit